MTYPILKASSAWFQSATKARPDFTIIRVVASYEKTGNEIEEWAADVNGNGDIMCYVVETETDIELIIAGNGSGKIALNEDSSFVFSVEGVTTTSVPTFKNVTHFYGAGLLDTSNVSLFTRAFAYMMALEYIDVSNWITSSATNMDFMFCAAPSIGSMKIKKLDVSDWDVGNVTSFKQAFCGCAELELLDTRNWNMTKAESINSMCRYCYKLKAIHSENWVAPNLTDLTSAFGECSSLKELDIKGLSNQKAAESKRKGVINGLSRLEKLTLGAKYTLSGAIGAPDNPSSDYIEGSDGKWHTLRGDSYDASEMPSGINITYYSSPLLVEKVLETPVMLSGVEALEIAEAIREKTGSASDLEPREWAAAIRGGK